MMGRRFRDRNPVKRARATAAVDLSPLDDDALLEFGDRDAAFTTLYERYAPRILTYCLIRMRNPEEAEDAAAQILISAYAHFPPDRRGSFRSWLFTIAHNHLANHWRAAARGPAIAGDALLDLIPDRSESLEEQAIRAEDASALATALAALTDDQRQVVELRLAGLSGAEIATVTGKSVPAVKMLQLRAVERLRTVLAPPTSHATSSEEASHA